MGRFGVFGHGTTQQAFLCLSREPTACFLELEANYLLVVQGGMRDRWVAPGKPNTDNAHCRLKAIWIRADCFPAKPARTTMPTAPPHLAMDPNVFQPKAVCRCIHAYAGIEHRPEDHGSLEGGYLSLCEGDNLTILSGEELGHKGNTFSNYVFAECKGKQGWCPPLLLAPSDVSVPLRWALVHDLQRSQGHNGQVLPVVGKRQNNRFVLLSNGKLLAVREQNVVLFYHDEAESLPQRRKHLLRRLHPDHSGDCYLFHLLGCSSLQQGREGCDGRNLESQ